MLRIVPLGALRNGFDVLLDGAPGPVAGFRGSVWREGGRIMIGPDEYLVQRERVSRFVLSGAAGPLAVADRRSAWTSRWAIWSTGTLYELAARGLLSRKMELRQDGRLVGRIAPTGPLTTAATAELPADLAPPVQVFVAAVVLALWRRAASG